MTKTIDYHVRKRQIQLAEAISARKKVYLDLRFWILLRDAAARENNASSICELLEILQHGVLHSILICPISESTFLELMKQKNTLSRRLGTARLIDELSLGVSLVPSPVRIGTEFTHYFLTGSGKHLFPVESLIWTKLSYTLGINHPFLPQLDRETNFELQKRFFDKMWKMSLSELVGSFGDVPGPLDSFDSLAERLNSGNSTHADELHSFEQTYSIEVAGALDACGDIVAEALDFMAEKTTGVSIERLSREWLSAKAIGKQYLIKEMEKSATQKALRSLHIQASLHAALRWNKTRKFKRNDFYDFHHAAAAVGYCDLFLTENSLRTLLTEKHLALHEINKCEVVSDIDQAIAYLKRLC